MAGGGGRRACLRAAAVIALWIVSLALAGCAGQAAAPATATPRGRSGEGVAVPAGTAGPVQQVPAEAGVVAPTPAPGVREGSTIPHLDSYLAKVYAASLAGDSAALAALGGNPNVDLAAGTVRVILEMDRSPEAHQAGPGVVEVVTLADGRKVEIQHAPPIAIRDDLAQAIAATGATYETAYEDLVQVLAPFGSLPGLAQIPDVRLVRPPLPAGS